MPTLNQRRKDATRLEIAEVALGLFGQEGYAHVTAEMIAEAASVSPRTFYRYFSTKDTVLGPIIDARASSLADALAARPKEESLIVAVQHAAAALATPRGSSDHEKPFVQIMRSTPDLYDRWLRDRTAWERPLAPVVHRRLGDSCSPEQAECTTALIVAALRLAFERLLADGSLERFGETLRQALGYLSSGAGLGLLPDNGSSRLSERDR